MNIILLNTIKCASYYQSPWLNLFSAFESFSWLIKVALSNKKLSCNERELNANSTVDNVVSYQFLCTLHIKFPKTGCYIFNNCSLHTVIFLTLQPAHCNIFNIATCLFSTFNILPLIISLLTKRTASVFLRQLFCMSSVLFSKTTINTEREQ